MGTREEQGKVRVAVRALLEKDRAAGVLNVDIACRQFFAGSWDLLAEGGPWPR
jgi:hypothetical protein